MALRAVGGIAVLALCCIARPALGQTSDAELLYQTGLKSFDAGDYVVACRSFAESYRLDPLPGALFTLATCEMRAGRVGSASTRFQEYIELVDKLAPEQAAKEADRRAVAERQRRELLRQTPYLKLVLPDAAAKSSEVRLNGAVVGSASINVELPVDPGEQVVEERLPNGEVRAQRITLGVGEHKLVILAAPNNPQHRPAAESPTPNPESASAPPRHALPYAVAGVGAVGLVVGSVSGILALAQASVVHAECNGPACSPRGKAAADRGKSWAWVSTVGFGVGLAGVATGSVLLLAGSAPPGRSPRTARLDLWLSPRAVSIVGAF